MRHSTIAVLLIAASLHATSAGATPVPSPLPPTTPIAEPTPIVSPADLAQLRARTLLFPVPDILPAAIVNTFNERRGEAAHEALDIPAPRGAPVIAIDDGTVAKLFHSVPGGLTVYLFDRERRFAYYYAHLERYADDLQEHQAVRRGQVIGYVGTSGNAPLNAPHLHFAIFKLNAEPRWWRGTALDAYPLWGAPR